MPAAAENPISTPELYATPKNSYGTGKNLLVVGYINTTGVTMNPSFTAYKGKENKTPKLALINAVNVRPVPSLES
jgi:hypothetical protein